MSPAASTRWCPTPEQVMILEEMYRGGVRTPNASHIQQITAHLSRYGKIEGKNVFYWFQNHKARDRQKFRKKLLGKQLHHHHHHHHHQQQQHPFDQIMFQIPPFLHHHQHFDQLPCCASSSFVGFNHPPQILNSPCFAPHQPRFEDTLARMANIRSEFGVENEKPMRISNDNDWVMRENHDYDNHSNYYDDDDDDDDDEHSTRRSLKTLELFPVKDN